MQQQEEQLTENASVTHCIQNKMQLNPYSVNAFSDDTADKVSVSIMNIHNF